MALAARSDQASRSHIVSSRRVAGPQARGAAGPEAVHENGGHRRPPCRKLADFQQGGRLAFSPGEAKNLPPASRRLRLALRARHYAHPRALAATEIPSIFVVVLWVDAITTTWAKGNLWAPLKPFTEAPVDGWEAIRSGHFDTASETVVASTVVPFIGLAVFLTLWVAPLGPAFATAAGRGLPLSKSTPTARRFRSVSAATNAVSACARAKKANWQKRPRELRGLASALTGVEDEVMRLHRSSVHLPPISQATATQGARRARRGGTAVRTVPGGQRRKPGSRTSSRPARHARRACCRRADRCTAGRSALRSGPDTSPGPGASPPCGRGHTRGWVCS